MDTPIKLEYDDERVGGHTRIKPDNDDEGWIHGAKPDNDRKRGILYSKSEHNIKNKCTSMIEDYRVFITIGYVFNCAD